MNETKNTNSSSSDKENQDLNIPIEEKEIVDETTDSLLQEDNNLKSELAEAKEKYLRLYADFENLRRRASKEKLEYIKTASEDVIVQLLPVVDDFERAQKSLETTKDIEAWKEGINLIYTKLFKILQQKGVQAMESVGKDFNPEHHESITQIPAPSEDLKGKIVDEVEKGYYLHDKIIRVAKVIIGN